MSTPAVTRPNHALLAEFEALIAARRPSLLRLATRCSGSPDPAVAEDIVQLAVVRAWSRLGCFSGRSTLSTWVHGFVANVARKQRGRSANASAVASLESLDELKGSASDALSDSLRREERRTLRRALGKLPRADRRAIVMRHLRGYDTSDLASWFGISEGTARVRLHRAQVRLAAIVGVALAA